jgi:hypothetical protein
MIALNCKVCEQSKDLRNYLVYFPTKIAQHNQNELEDINLT